MIEDQSVQITDDGVEYRLIGDGYAAGADGSIWSIRRGGRWKRLRPIHDNYGYGHVSIYRDGKQFKPTIHSLVIRAFRGPPPFDRADCRHLDGNPVNNVIDNLEWGTRTQNMQDAARHGTIKRGEQLPQHVLTDDQVVAARRLAAAGVSIAQVARDLRMDYETVRGAINGRRWKHIPGAVPTGTSGRKGSASSRR